MFKMPKPLKRQDQHYTIYVLIDPRDDTIHYVGMSKDAQFRLFQHLHRSVGGESKQARHWMNELQQSDLTPILKILETIETTDDAYSVACEREHYWIEKLLRAGVPLLNVKGVSGPHPRTVGRPTGAIGKATPRTNMPTLEDLHLEAHLSAAVLSRKAGVDMKTIKRAIDGEPVQKVKAVAIVVLRSLKAIRKETMQVTTCFGRSSPHPGLGTTVELSRSNTCRLLDLVGKGLALPG